MTLQTAMFYSYAHASAAVNDLRQAGVTDDNLSLISNDADKVYEMEQMKATLDDAGTGTTVGGAVGVAGGLMAGLGVIAIPGIGPLIAAGWLTTALAGLVTGSVIGATAGSLFSLWEGETVSREEADRYAEHIRQGGSLVSVRGDDLEPEQVQAILNRHQNAEIAQGTATYRRRSSKMQAAV